MDLRFSAFGVAAADEKLCDWEMWFFGYEAGTTGVGTGAGRVGGGPGFGAPALTRRNCFDWRYMMVSPNIRVGDESSWYAFILDGIDSSTMVLSSDESGVWSTALWWCCVCGCCWLWPLRWLVVAPQLVWLSSCSNSVYATGNQPNVWVRKFSPNCQPLALSPTSAMRSPSKKLNWFSPDDK